MKKKFFTKFGVLAVVGFILPMVTFAQSNDCAGTYDRKSFESLINYFTCVVGGSVVKALFALGLVVFIWGVVQYVITDNEEKRAKGKQFMIWGLIGLFVMFAVWGLVDIISGTFGFSSGNLKAPMLPVLGP